jgi:hypothetical protein
MNMRKPVWWLVALLCGVGLGLLAGRMVWEGKGVKAADQRTTLFVVKPNGEMYYVPVTGEEIHWVRPNYSDPDGRQSFDVKVRFRTGSPCVGNLNNTSVCVIREDAKGGFLFVCENGDNGKPRCKDPGIEPNSSTEPLRYSLTSRASGVTNTANALPTTKDTDQTDLNFSVSCIDGNVVVSDEAGKPIGDKANVKDGILWDANTFVPDISMVKTNSRDPDICKVQTSGFQAKCSVGSNLAGKKYKMEVKAKDATLCKGNVTATITVVP